MKSDVAKVRRNNVGTGHTALIDAPTASRTPWYKEAVIYELHVRSFYDGDGNGSGDFVGLIEKLDYIQGLGVTAIWLLPFCPSPGRDDGYDISDYVGVHSSYGCLDDFRRFLGECKRRDLRVITELVLNHTSDQHPWFQRARRSPAGSSWRDYYVWSDTPERYEGVRIIFNDFEDSNWTWDPIAEAYYWHRFYSHQPDLNFDSADVRATVFDAVDFWLSMGVDGLRLDAVPYLFEREGTNCENLPETHAFLRELRSYVDAHYEDRMLLAEANQWPEDAVTYFGSGDECHMAFNFPLMPRLFMAMRMEDSFPIVNIVQQTPLPPPECQWATFLRNHDELTLEMVGDEERDYMFRSYAQDPDTRINTGIRRRLAPLLGNDRRRIKLMNALLFSLPGTPVVYYGDEIGMGDNLTLGDRNCVRTPMQWTADANAGFSSADAESLYLPLVTAGEYAHDFINVESQLKNVDSLLWWTRHVLGVRRNSDALTTGDIEVLSHGNRHVLAFLRKSPHEEMLVVANLSRYAQPLQLPLGSHAGGIPVEVFGHVDFPAITSDSYQLSLTPYGFYWFRLRKPVVSGNGSEAEVYLPVIDSFDWENRPALAETLTPHVTSTNLLQARETTLAEVVDLIRFGRESAIAIVSVSFSAGEPELQFIPLTIRSHPAPSDGERVIAIVRSADCGDARLSINAAAGEMSNALLELISAEGQVRTSSGLLRGVTVGTIPLGVRTGYVCLRPDLPAGHQRNASVVLSNVYVLKVFRHLDVGQNADISIVRYLFEEAGFSHVAPVFGKLEYVRDGRSFDAAVLHAYVDSRTDLWQFTIDELSLWIERAAAASPNPLQLPESNQTYMRFCRLLAKRTAEMHLALMGPPGSDFAPEQLNHFSLRGACHAMESRAEIVRQALINRVPEQIASLDGLDSVLDGLQRVRDVFANITTLADPGVRIRCHGDFHLGQVLHTGDDLVFIDFEGDNSRPLADRLIKTSPLVDVAAMLQSLRYAATSIAFNSTAGDFAWRGRVTEKRRWVQRWFETASALFISEYRQHVRGAGLVPNADEEFNRMLDMYLLDKAIYQIAYELRYRPDWLPIALRVFSDTYGALHNGHSN
jgi:maltose alpha-D-glucosyltransferase/alpha-amylase